MQFNLNYYKTKAKYICFALLTSKNKHTKTLSLDFLTNGKEMLKFLGCYMAGMLINIVGFIIALAALVFVNHAQAPFETYLFVHGLIIWIFGAFACRIITPCNFATMFIWPALSIFLGFYITSIIFRTTSLLEEPTYFYTIAFCSLYVLIQGGVLYLCGNRTNRKLMSFFGVIHNLSLAGILSAGLCFYHHINLF